MARPNKHGLGLPIADTSAPGLAYFDSTDFSVAEDGKVSFLATSAIETVSTDSGTVTPASSAITVAGGAGIDTSGSGATLTIAGETATDSNAGIIEIATDAETIAASDTGRAVVPSNLAALTATNLTALSASTSDVQARTSTAVYVTPASLAADGEIQQKTVAISTAEMEALETTPKALVAGQAGKVIHYLGGVITADFNATAFDDAAADGDLVVRLDTAGTVVSTALDGDGFVDAVADTVKTLKPLTTDITLVPGEGLELFNDGAAFTSTGGDTTFSITFNYIVYDDAL